MQTTRTNIATAEAEQAQEERREAAADLVSNTPQKSNEQPAASEATKPRVVVVGAGFGGLNAARALGDTGVDVLVVDRNNYHGFWPLLYQVATAALEPDSIAYPVRAILRKFKNVGFRMAEVRGVDFERRRVLTNTGEIAYDYLVLAAGSANNYFGNNALAENTIGLKDIDDAERLRNKMLSAFERAISAEDPQECEELLTFVVIGGGPTGVELAGALSELITFVLRKDYPMLDVSQARIILVEATDKILAAFPPGLQKQAQKKLKQMGVQVRLNSPVESVSEREVTFKDGSKVKAQTVVWAAGVRASTITDELHLDLGKGSRVKIKPTLQIKGHPEVFAIGDMAYLEGYKGDQAYPMVAQVAIQQGRQAARNILAHAAGKPMKPFHYFDKGTMATIGRRAAVLDAFGIHLTGRLAWLGWLLIHIIYLIGFRNKLIVLTNWAFNYLTYERGVRLITHDERR